MAVRLRAGRRGPAAGPADGAVLGAVVRCLFDRRGGEEAAG